MGFKKVWLGGLASCMVLMSMVGCANDYKQSQNMGNEDGMRTTRVGDQIKRMTQNNDRMNQVQNTRQGRDGSRINNQYDMDRGMSTNENNVARGVRYADDIAREISDLKEVDSAYVLMMGRRAYVAVMLDPKAGQRELTSQLKRKIAQRAKAVDPLVQRVYVSANPDFVKQLRDYSEDIQTGRPVEGIVDQLSDIIRRTFPEAK